MLLAAVESVRKWGARHKRILSGLFGVAVEGACQCVPGVGWAGKMLGELVERGVDRLLDPNAEVPGVKQAGETIPAEQLAQLNTWLEKMTAGYGGLIERLDVLIGDQVERPDAELTLLLKRTLVEHADLARAFDSSVKEVRRLTFSLAGIERRLDQHCHILHGVQASLEAIKGMLTDSPVLEDWARLRQARPDALDAILRADEHFLAGRREEGVKALLDLLGQRGVGQETLCHQLGLLSLAGGQVQQAESYLRQSVTLGGNPPPSLARALTSTATALERGGGLPAWSTLPSGLVINRRYRLEAEVGRGGMASVYRASGIDRLNRGQPVAIKVPAPELMKDEQTCDRFVQEILVSQRLSSGRHPAVVQTIGYEVFEAPDGAELYGLVLEFVQGRSLADYLAERKLRQRPLSPTEVLNFLGPVCDALIFAHEQSPPILHRDVKPANVMLTPRGEAKLMDFGIARVLDERGLGLHTSGAVGTPVYMPPEFLNPASGVDARSDIYLAGNLLLELLTLHPMGDPESRPDCPAGWVDLINDSMSRVRARRPATMRDFLARLRGAFPGEGKRQGGAVGTVRDFLSRLAGSWTAEQSAQAAASPPPAEPPAVKPASVKPPPPPASIPTAMLVPEEPVPAKPEPAPPPLLTALPVHDQPAGAVAGPRLEVTPARLDLVGLHAGKEARFRLQLVNRGGGELAGTVSSEWEGLSPVRGPRFRFDREATLELAIPGDWLQARPRPHEGRLVLESNGGTVTVEVRAEVPITPFGEGVLAGASSPRQLAELARKQPRESAPLFESGAVARWFERNGWPYPVQGPTAAGLAALQQFFEAMGLSAPPRLILAEAEVRLHGSPGTALEHPLTITAQERRLIYVQASSDQAWLVVRQVRCEGTTATVALAVPHVPGVAGDIWLATVTVVGNGGQRFEVPIELKVGAAGPALAPTTCVNLSCRASNPGGARHCQQCRTPLLGAMGTLVRGRYRLEELLSTGDGVAVYRATDVQEGNRPVLLEDLLETRPLNFLQKQQQFRHTVEKLRRLQPLPAVPRLYDFIEEGQTALVVREAIAGRPLDEVLKHDGALGVARVWAWATQLCDVLAFMHALRPPYLWMVLQPRDLVLQDDGRTLRLWQRSRSVMPWREQGAARYVAAEVLAGKAEPRSDLFTLAATLYHLATGKPPEGAETGRELQQKVEREGHSLGEEAVFWLALARNLADSPGERHASALALRAALVGTT